MRIRSRSGPLIAAFPLAAGTVGDCRMCRENREVMDTAIRAVHEGDSFKAMGIAEEWTKQIEGHSCKKMIDSSFMPPRRGRWLSVRVEVGVYDPVLREDYRIPIARADVLAVGGASDCPDFFHVVDTPNLPKGGELDLQEGRIAQWYLGNLDRDERKHLLCDLKEV